MLVEEPFSLTLTCSMIAYGLLWQLMSEAQELMSGLFLPRDTYLTIMGISMMASQRHVKNISDYIQEMPHSRSIAFQGTKSRRDEEQTMTKQTDMKPPTNKEL